MRVFFVASLVWGVSLVAAGAQERRVAAPELAIEGMPFSPGIVYGDFLSLSGSIGLDAERRLPEGIEAQTRQTLANLRAVLEAEGLDFSDTVKSNVYLTDSRHYQAMNAVYSEHFQDGAPTRATVESDLALPDALIEISLVAVREGVETRTITPDGWPEPSRPYRWGIATDDTLFVSGMVSRDVPSGQLVLGDVATQTEQVLRNVGAVLTAAGMDFGDVVSSVVYLSEARDFQAMNAAYREFFGGDDPPARATVRSRLMNPALKVEIQCLAVRDPQRRVVAAGPRSSSPFSPSILSGGRHFLAGMVGRGENGFPPGDVQAQTRLTLLRLQATLDKAGLGFADVVEATVYLPDVRHFAAMNEIYREFLPANFPARTTVGSALMSPDALVEIMMTAVASDANGTR